MMEFLIPAAANVIGGILGNKSQSDQQEQNIRMQREFAQNGIRWKVEDAKNAGIHPLYALGAQTHSFAPVSVGGSPLAEGLSRAGQDVGRAINATSTDAERASGYAKTVQELSIQRMGLENELLASQIAKVRQVGSAPAMPSVGSRHLIDGQGDSAGGPLIMDQALKRVTSAPESPNQEAGSVADMGFSRTPTGWAPIMSKDYQERTEEDFLGSAYWNLRNRLIPGFSGQMSPPPIKLKEHEYWYFNPVKGEYQIRKLERGRGGFYRWDG